MADYQVDPTTRLVEMIRMASAVVAGITAEVKPTIPGELRKSLTQLQMEAIAFLRQQFG